jgi:ADP-heptose:LPS heptosyltransferase
MNALVYHNGALGDFLTILPALRMYRTVISANKITILCRKQFGELACSAGYADRFLDINYYSFLFNPSAPDSRTDSFFNQFNHCLIFSGDDSPLLKMAQQYSHLKILYQTPFPAQPVHVIDYHLSLFGSTSAQFTSGYPCLTRLFSSFPCQNSKRNSIAIAPGSGSIRKNWLLERFQTIADYLESQGYQVFWIAGECEAEFTFRDKDQLLRNTDLVSLSRFLHGCTLFIGNDSGVTHLAAASGCPVIALFGASNPAIWAPRGISKVRCIVSTVCLEYCQTNNRKIDCIGECMKSILVEEVTAAVDTMLNQYLSPSFNHNTIFS